MATTPNLGLPIAAPEENTKTFYEFRNELYESMMKIDSEFGELQKNQSSGTTEQVITQANYAQNDSTATDYIKNRPFYEITSYIDWDGDTTDRVKLSDYNPALCIYDAVTAPALPDDIDAYPYRMICQDSQFDAEHTASTPYLSLYCSDVAFTYGDANSTQETSGKYSTDCTVQHYIWIDPFNDTWELESTTSFPNDTEDYFFNVASTKWTNTDILMTDGTKFYSACIADILLNSTIDGYKVSDETILTDSYEYIVLSLIAGNGETVEIAASDLAVCTHSDPKCSLLLAGSLIVVSASAAGSYQFMQDTMPIPINIPEAGIYFVLASADDGDMYVNQLANVTIQKIASRFLPYHFIEMPDASSVDYSVIDFSQYQSGDVIFLVGDVI